MSNYNNLVTYDANSPKTVNDFLEKLPFSVDLNVWGDEIYTSESPIIQF